MRLSLASDVSLALLVHVASNSILGQESGISALHRKEMYYVGYFHSSVVAMKMFLMKSFQLENFPIYGIFCVRILCTCSIPSYNSELTLVWLRP